MHKTGKMVTIEARGGNSHFKTKHRIDTGHPRLTNTTNPEETSNTQYQAYHQSQTNTGTSIRHQAGSHNPCSTSRNDSKQKHEINQTAETFNCHGFAQSSDYIIHRLDNCDILCLTETWIWPHEVNLISETIHNHRSKSPLKNTQSSQNVVCMTENQTTRAVGMEGGPCLFCAWF